ncbi:hypothetical protein ACIP5N_21850 [Streptomyces sp. NPDC088768]|uniref:hypothetical protein n=1 Tax=Streptomyces sp. NPDC088768 TaxID=3365894 RepID=UPI003807328F
MHTHLMQLLQTVAKEIVLRTTYEELCDPHMREQLARDTLNVEELWAELPPGRVDLPRLVTGALDDAAAAAQKSFGPGTLYRIVMEILVGTPEGYQIELISHRTELVKE